MRPNIWALSQSLAFKLVALQVKTTNLYFSFVTTASVLRLNIARKFLVCSTNWIRAAKAQALVSRSYGELSNFMEAKFGWRVRQGKALHFASRLERAPTQAENLKVLPACFRHSRFLGRFIWV